VESLNKDNIYKQTYHPLEPVLPPNNLPFHLKSSILGFLLRMY
jgi:hypothetical protein